MQLFVFSFKLTIIMPLKIFYGFLLYLRIIYVGLYVELINAVFMLECLRCSAAIKIYSVQLYCVLFCEKPKLVAATIVIYPPRT